MADGGVLHYHALGRGETIALLAGGPGLSGDCLLPLGRSLAGENRVLVPDQRGTGRSRGMSLDPSALNLGGLLGDLERLREQAGVERWSLLGHSWGGILAMAYAARWPKRVERLVLVSPGGVNAEFLRYYPANIATRLGEAERLELGYWQQPARVLANPVRALLEVSRIVAPAMVFDRKKALPLVERTLSEMRFNPLVNVLLTEGWYEKGYDLRRSLRRVAAPILVVQGRQDPLGEATALQIAETAPNVTVRFIERCGHWAFAERPRELLASVRAFLRKRAPRGQR